MIGDSPMCTWPAVPPSVPAGPVISDITSSQAKITWTLTNRTLDEGPDRLTLTVNYINNTQVRQYLLSAGTGEMLVQSIAPGMEYLVTVSASNQDGTRTTAPVPFQTLPGRKHMGYLVCGGCIKCPFFNICSSWLLNAHSYIIRSTIITVQKGGECRVQKKCTWGGETGEMCDKCVCVCW